MDSDIGEHFIEFLPVRRGRPKLGFYNNSREIFDGGLVEKRSDEDEIWPPRVDSTGCNPPRRYVFCFTANELIARIGNENARTG